MIYYGKFSLVDYELDPLSVVRNDARNIFQKRGMKYAILLN